MASSPFAGAEATEVSTRDVSGRNVQADAVQKLRAQQPFRSSEQQLKQGEVMPL